MILLFFSILAILSAFLISQKLYKRRNSKFSECAICLLTFPEEQIESHDNYPLCPEHLELYKNSNWVKYKVAISTPNNSLEGVKLYEEKVKLWINKKIPSVINSDYNIVEDEIQTELQLFIRDIDLKILNKKAL